MWPCLGPIKTYGPVYFAGIVVHFVTALLIARRLRLKWPVPLLASVCYLLGMTVGAKILFDIRAGIFSLGNLVSAEHYMRGGMWGGPLVYLGLAVPLMLVLSRDRRAAIDLVALAAPIPMAIAKVACLCNGCCHGRPTGLPWAITFPESGRSAPAGVPLHPTQLYEMLVLVLVAVVLYLVNQPRRRGTLLFWFLAVYGIGRPLTECFRGDLAKQVLWGPFTQSQWLCAAAGGLSICILLAHHRRHRRRSPDPLPQSAEQDSGPLTPDN